ncbi:MAG TPA: hypothetical protein VIJ38_00640 [Acidobacteriaceae bacterium]
MRFAAMATMLILAVPVAGYGQGTSSNADQVSIDYVRSANPHMLHSGTASAGGGYLGKRSNGNVLGVDSIANWSSYFYEAAADGSQYTWSYTMVGSSPLAKGGDSDEDSRGNTTRINAPVIAVNIDLRNYDGTPRYLNGVRLYLAATQLVAPVLSSPVFEETSYDSSEDPTQFMDAVMRAEFFHKTGDDWHTLLSPRVATARTIVLIRGTYQFATNSDGTVAYVLVDEGTFYSKLFPATPTDTTTPIGAAENGGDIRTSDISTFLFNNVFLTSGGACCILGFHTYDVEPGNAKNGWQERRYVLNYSSWITPGLFADPNFADITALSHEMTETFNDPFVNNATPWYLAPNGNCQNNLETGDAIEGLPNAEYTISLHGTLWHPQNEALLQWFAGVTPSSARDHAYSYPDPTVLTSAAVPVLPGCPQ